MSRRFWWWAFEKYVFVFIPKIAWAELYVFHTWTAGDAFVGPPKWSITNKRWFALSFSGPMNCGDGLSGIVSWGYGYTGFYLILSHHEEMIMDEENSWKAHWEIQVVMQELIREKKISHISDLNQIFLDVLSRATLECTHRLPTSLTGSTPICKLEP